MSDQTDQSEELSICRAYAKAELAYIKCRCPQAGFVHYCQHFNQLLEERAKFIKFYETFEV